ncbi:hypothetical protein Tco_0161316, partial [Tanacetum coccineum]
YDFLCMPSLDKVTVKEEPHGIDTSILDRVVDHTISPAPAGTAIPHAILGEIVVTRPNHKVDDGTLDDDHHHDDTEFTMEDIKSPNDVNQDTKDVDDGGNGGDGNVDPYYEARVGNTAGDVLERDL